jgi:hypothetical protein
VDNPSPCLSTGSSLPTYSTRTTAGALPSNLRPLQPATAFSQIPPSSTYKTTCSGCHVRFPYVSPPKQQFPWGGGDVGAFHGNLPHTLCWTILKATNFVWVYMVEPVFFCIFSVTAEVKFKFPLFSYSDGIFSCGSKSEKVMWSECIQQNCIITMENINISVKKYFHILILVHYEFVQTP